MVVTAVCASPHGLKDDPPVKGTRMSKTADLAVADSWDAGALGCGELVMQLRSRMLALEPGEVLELIATDDGAVIDIPAWCSLTGHALAAAEPPRFLIQRKDS